MLKQSSIQIAIFNLVLTLVSSAPESISEFTLLALKTKCCKIEDFSEARNDLNEPIITPDPTAVDPINAPPYGTPRDDNVEWDELLPEQSPVPLDERAKEFWKISGQKILKETLARKTNTNIAKNLIILVADGMSIPTQTATRMYLGGEKRVLSFEKFPYVGLSKVRRENFSIKTSGELRKFKL